MGLRVIKESCVGCGLCESKCSDCFKVEGGLAEVIGDNLNCNCKMEDVIESCPAKAIVIDE